MKPLDIDMAFVAMALPPFALLFNLNSKLPVVVDETDGTILKSHKSAEPLALTRVCELFVLSVLNINSTPFGSAPFDYQSNARLLEPEDRLSDFN